jgi:hypothetical protein
MCGLLQLEVLRQQRERFHHEYENNDDKLEYLHADEYV